MLALLSVTLRAQDWPMYLKDLTHSSFDTAESRLDVKTITTLQPAWTASMGAALVSGVTVSNGVLYFGDWGGTFNAVDAQTGNILWRTFIGKAPAPSDPNCFPGIGVSSQSTVVGNTVFVGGGDAAVYALDISKGSQIWRVPLGDPAAGFYLWSSVAPYHSALYVGVASLADCPIARGALARIDPANPQQPLIQYVVPAGVTGGGIWSTPAIDAATNEVFVNTDNGALQDAASGYWNGALLKLDANTLQIKSYYLLPESDALSDQGWGSSPILFTPSGGVPLMASSAKNGILYANRRSDLALAWQVKLAVGCVDPELGCGAISTPAFDGTTLFAGAGVRDPNSFSMGSVYAINPLDGSVIWERDTDGVVLAPVTIANKLLFVSTTQGLEIYDTATGQFLWSDQKRGSLYSQPVVLNGTVYSTYVSGSLVAWTIPPAGPQTLSSVSAASGLPSLAPEAAASVFSTNLDTATVTIQDSTGVQRMANVLYSSPGQINYVVPGETATGRAKLTVTTGNGTTLWGALQISNAAPGIYSANSDGKGIAAAQVLTVKADGTQSYSLVFQCGSAPGTCVAAPIDLGTATDQVFLILYGTGIRGLTGLNHVSCWMGGVRLPVLYAGPQYDYDGFDQVNVLIPANMRGRGQMDVTLSVDGQLSNTVTVSVQ